MHKGACEQEVKSRRCCAKGLDVLFASALWQQTPNRLVLITILAWYFQFHLMNVSILHLKYEYGAQSKSRFACCSYVTWGP